jgi:pentatricopeptide repeat protein
MGLKLYREIVSSGMEPNPVTHSAMIYLCTRSKRSFESAISFYDQMKLLNFPIHLRVHNYMIQGCSKVADLDRAITIWNNLIDKCLTDPKLKPNEFSLSSILWTFASVETLQLKLSKRDFHYELDGQNLVNLATEIYRQGTSIMKTNGHLSNGYLAVLTDNLVVEKAEDFFNNEMIEIRTEHSYELMFKMYDSLRNFDKTNQLKIQMDSENIVVPFEGWRAMIRTAAL